MTSSTFNWFKRLVVLGSVVAVGAAFAAGASGAVTPSTAPDVFERYAAAHPYGSTSVPDVLERYAATHPYGSTSVPDVLERYAAAHPSGVGALTVGTDRIVDDWFRDPTPIATPTGDRIVDDWFRDPAVLAAPARRGIGDFRTATPIATPTGDRIVDDYFRDAPTVVNSPAPGNGLDWGDFGIGAGAMLGLTLLVVGLGLAAIAMRNHRGGRLETS